MIDRNWKNTFKKIDAFIDLLFFRVQLNRYPHNTG